MTERILFLRLSIIMNFAAYSQFQELSRAHQGVFSLNELRNFLQSPNKVQFYRELERLKKENVIGRLSRGMYVAPNGNLDVASQKICPRSYISFGNVLAQAMLIGTIPQKAVYAVKTGKSRIYRGAMGTVVQLGLKPELFFGYEVKNGVAYADPEKAFLDTLYFHQKGQKYFFDIYSDIAVDLLDKKKLRNYLKKYKNSRFVQFVKGVLNAKN